ncbi:thermonuclease family protein, partial [Microbulbifer aggregans]|uniref:thermonuclease family protein n=1 Tax=Microbulbifer aggregans TaxID=1769779 RepID=UPI001CFC7CC8
VGVHARTAFISGTVISVYDGDTITIRQVSSGSTDGTIRKIRFYGIDAPEAGAPGRWESQAYSRASKEFVEAMLLGKEVTVRYDGMSYDRVVGEVFVDGRSASRELVRAGLAWWSQKYAGHDTDLKRIEEVARTEGKGLWAQENPVSPWSYRDAATKKSSQ